MSEGKLILLGLLLIVVMGVTAAIVRKSPSNPFSPSISPAPTGQAETPPSPSGVNFSETGILVQLPSKTWVLVYEKTGEPIYNVTLLFTNKSQCGSGNKYSLCSPNKLKNGETVRVEGVENDRVVSISKLTRNPK